jgi:hypothetical protein
MRLAVNVVYPSHDDRIMIHPFSLAVFLMINDVCLFAFLVACSARALAAIVDNVNGSLVVLGGSCAFLDS